MWRLLPCLGLLSITESPPPLARRSAQKEQSQDVAPSMCVCPLLPQHTASKTAPLRSDQGAMLPFGCEVPPKTSCVRGKPALLITAGQNWSPWPSYLKHKLQAQKQEGRCPWCGGDQESWKLERYSMESVCFIYCNSYCCVTTPSTTTTN